MALLGLIPLILLVLGACAEVSTGVPAVEEAAAADEVERSSLAPGSVVPERYIVVFGDHVRNPRAQTDSLVRGTGGTVHFRYETVLEGFSASLPPAAVEGSSAIRTWRTWNR